MSIGSSIKRTLGKIRLKLYPVCNLLCGLFPMKKEIILESYPDLTCNTFELYRYMLKQGLNKKYQLTWLVGDPEQFKDCHEENVSFTAIKPKGLPDKVRLYVRTNRAAAAIASNRRIQRYRTSKKQLNIYLDHGSQLKGMLIDGVRYNVSCDYTIAQSSFFVPYITDVYDVSREQVIVTGLPRNDQMYRKYDTISRIFPDIGEFKKSIIWVPTFRQHRRVSRVDVVSEEPFGLPLFQSEEMVRTADELLRKLNVLLIIKPHPSQYLGAIKEFSCSNIRFIYNDDLSKNDIQTNELLAQTDAMITDYSSIYYDYLLLDRPIAITLDDFQEYCEQKGFVFEHPLDILKGYYLYTIEDLCGFIQDVAAGEDRTLDERTKIKELTDDFLDDNSSKRVYDFIMENLKV